MRRRVAITLTATVVCLSVGSALAPSANARPRNQISWQYSESANGYYREPSGRESGGDGGPATVRYVYGAYNDWAECPAADPAFNCDAGVTGMKCAIDSVGPRGLPRFPWIRYERTIQPDGTPTLWVGVDAACSEPSEDDFVPMEEISTQLNYEVIQDLAEPQVDLFPAVTTIVKLPTIVSTDYPENIGPPATVLDNDPPTIEVPIDIPRPGGGLTGRIHAIAKLEWTFEDGGSAEGRGKPYKSGITPKSNPNYGYVTATFVKAGNKKSITLNVQWTGTVTVETLDPENIVPVDLDPIVTYIEVRQSKPVLGGN